MFILPYFVGFLFLLALILRLCGVNPGKITFIIVCVVIGCFYLFIAGCLHLIAVIFAVNGYPWVHVAPFVFLGIVGWAHYKYSRG